MGSRRHTLILAALVLSQLALQPTTGRWRGPPRGTFTYQFMTSKADPVSYGTFCGEGEFTQEATEADNQRCYFDHGYKFHVYKFTGIISLATDIDDCTVVMRKNGTSQTWSTIKFGPGEDNSTCEELTDGGDGIDLIEEGCVQQDMTGTVYEAGDYGNIRTDEGSETPTCDFLEYVILAITGEWVRVP